MGRLHIVLLASFIFMSGCSVPWYGSTKQVEAWPVLPTPAKIVLALPADNSKITKEDLLDALYLTIEYTKKLEVTIEIYNASAIAHNGKVRENLGLTP
jgi:hypothetical protein